MQAITTIDRCRRCDRHVIAPELGTLTARTEDGQASSRGRQLCESIWACAACEASRRAEDTHELTTAALRWLARGGTLIAGVLTTRHVRTDALDDLVCALLGTRRHVDETTGEVTERTPGAYQRLLSDPGFYGRAETVSTWRRKDGTVGQAVRPPEPGLRHRIGYVGMARNTELTRSKAGGWHPHLNVLIFVGGTLDGTPAKGDVVGVFAPATEDLTHFEDWLRGFWAGALRSIDPAYETSKECDRRGCKCKGQGHGVQLDVITSPDDKALIRYLTKAGGEKTESVKADVDAAKSAAAETAHSTAKAAKGEKSMTAFQILDRLWAVERDGLAEADAPGYGTTEQCRTWWLEYETATRGRRAFEMTRGLARHTDLAGELEAYRYQQMHVRLVAGVVLTQEAHTHVTDAEQDYTASTLVAAGRETDVPELVADAGGREDHARVVDEAGATEWVESLAEVMAAKARQRAAERAEWDRLAEAGHGLVPCEPCGGTGHREEYAAIHGGKCYSCDGTGRVIGDADDDQEHDDG
ncbi:replication protein [Streptomyces albidoflavus]